MPMPRNNSGDPILASEWNEFADAIDLNTAKVGIPAGGTTGQALIKGSVSDYDTEWNDIATGGLPAFFAVPEPKPSVSEDVATFGPHLGTTTNRAHVNPSLPYYYPLSVWRDVNVQSLTFVVNSATLGVATDTVRLSVYNEAGGVATSLLPGWDFSTIITATGTTTVEITGLDLNLAAGSYFVRWRTDLAACAIKAYNVVGWRCNTNGAAFAFRSNSTATADAPAPATAETFNQASSQASMELFAFRGVLL